MELTASTTSAVSSMMAGVLPEPTPMAGLPLEWAARTIPGPPVASVRSACCIKRFVNSRDGASIQSITPAGAPALAAASRTIFAASIVHRAARGCGERMTALRVLSASRHLKIAVDVGFVVGITAAITPTGSAIRWMP